MSIPVTWTADGHPRSLLYDDLYRPHAGALAQAEGAFLAGCGLPQRWRAAPSSRCSKPASGWD